MKEGIEKADVKRTRALAYKATQDVAPLWIDTGAEACLSRLRPTTTNLQGQRPTFIMEVQLNRVKMEVNEKVGHQRWESVPHRKQSRTSCEVIGSTRVYKSLRISVNIFPSYKLTKYVKGTGPLNKGITL